MKPFTIDSFPAADYKLYEKMVAAIIAGQLKQSDADDVHTVEHDAQHPYEYNEKQIDVRVATESPDDDGDEQITLVECKFHQDNVEQDVIASLAFYLDHSDADAAVVVAREGFQTGAKNIARGRDDIRLFTVGEVTAEEQAQFLDTIEIDLTLTFSDYRHVVRVEPVEGGDWRRLRAVAAGVPSTDIELLTPDGEPTGETVHARLEANARGGTGKIETEFDGERVEIDGEEYEVLEAVSQENPGPVTSKQLIEYADQFEIKMADPLALEDAPDDLDQSEKAKLFKSFDKVRRDLFHIESG